MIYRTICRLAGDVTARTVKYRLPATDSITIPQTHAITQRYRTVHYTVGTVVVGLLRFVHRGAEWVQFTVTVLNVIGPV